VRREDALRAKLTAAILFAELALEHVSDGPARELLERANSALWAASSLLKDQPPMGGAGPAGRA
jgi:hypothetical protein